MRDVTINVQVTAAILGVSTDAVRDHPSRYGLHPKRTNGGHRRYRLQDVLESARRLQKVK